MMGQFAKPKAGKRRPNSSGSTPWSLAAEIVFIVILTFPVGCGENGGGQTPIVRHLADFLPPGTELMPKAGEPRTASDNAGFRDIIKDGFEYYTSNGVLEMVEQMYSGTVGGTSAAARVWIFDMGTAENAASLHDLLIQEGAWEDWNVFGDQDHRKGSELGFVILFRRDNYSVQLDISSNSQEARDLLALFASHIDNEIQG